MGVSGGSSTIFVPEEQRKRTVSLYLVLEEGKYPNAVTGRTTLPICEIKRRGEREAVTPAGVTSTRFRKKHANDPAGSKKREGERFEGPTLPLCRPEREELSARPRRGGLRPPTSSRTPSTKKDTTVAVVTAKKKKKTESWRRAAAGQPGLRGLGRGRPISMLFGFTGSKRKESKRGEEGRKGEAAHPRRDLRCPVMAVAAEEGRRRENSIGAERKKDRRPPARSTSTRRLRHL